MFHINGDYISHTEKLQIKISGDAHSSCHILLNTLKGTKILNFTGGHFILQAIAIDKF